MDHRVSKDMISSGMTPSGEKSQADLGKSQYGSAPSPSKLTDAYHSMYQNQKEETLEEGKVNAGLQAFLDKKKGKKKDEDDDEKSGKKGSKPDFLDLDKDGDKKEPMKKAAKEDVDMFDLVSTKLIDEGYDEKDVYKVMANLTEEQLQELLGLTALGALATGGAKVLGGLGAKAAAGGAGKALAGAAAKKGLGAVAKKGTMMVGKQLGGTQGARIGAKAADAFGKMDNFSKVQVGSMALNTAGNVANKLNPLKGGGQQQGNNLAKTRKSGMVSAGADLFDIVKGKLLDEGLNEEEIKDIMLELTPDEILEQLSDIVKRNDAIAKANAAKSAQKKEVPQNVRDAAKRQYKAGTSREDPKNPYTTDDKKTIINQYKDN